MKDTSEVNPVISRGGKGLAVRLAAWRTGRRTRAAIVGGSAVLARASVHTYMMRCGLPFCRARCRRFKRHVTAGILPEDFPSPQRGGDTRR